MKRLFLVIFSLIFLAFSVLGIFFPDSKYLAVLKVAGIFLCFLYAAVFSFRTDKMLALALFLTFIADVILAVNNLAIIGVGIFALAQLVHILRMTDWDKRFWAGYLIALMVILGVGLIEKTEPIFIAGSVYAVSLISNLMLAREWYKRGKTREARNAYFGFLLFLGCDLNVLLSFFSLTGVIFMGAYRVVNYLAWEFYFPSQILISKSGKV